MAKENVTGSGLPVSGCNGGVLPQKIRNIDDMEGWRGGWRKVYICAPYDGYFTRSREKQWSYGMFAKQHGCIPVAPHYYYTEFWCEMDEMEKAQIDRMALTDLRGCDELWVFGEKMTADMKKDLRYAAQFGLNIRWFPDWDIILHYTMTGEY